MTAEQRRSRISARLHEAHQPISATALAKELGVSRQIIVGDVALLRAAGQAITATARGYVIPDAGETGLPRQVACRHDGTGTRAQISGIKVAGKTGTAENGDRPPLAWFISFAPADDPQVAVAVVVEDGGDRLGATGGALAAPIGRAVIKAALQGQS